MKYADAGPNVPTGTWPEDCGMMEFEEELTAPAIIENILTKKELVECHAPAIKDMVLQNHTPAEAIVKLDFLRKLADEADRLIRAEVLKELDGSYTLDAYGRFNISRAKAPAKWEYLQSAVRDKLIADIEERKRELKEVEAELQKQDKAIDQNENAYIVKLTERKLTIKENHGQS